MRPSGSRYHQIHVIYEDDSLLAVNKPAFVDYDLFVDEINRYLKRTNPAKRYPYLGQMHRLDKETSGLLLFTKKKMANKLADQFRNRTIQKFYLAVVTGRLEKEHGIISFPLEKRPRFAGKKSFIVPEGKGKMARTEYWVEERYESATYVKILLGTGRTHQIRVHFSAIGHPVVGESVYVDHPPENAPFPIKRHALHAERVVFKHPVDGHKMDLSAPVPKDIIDLIDFLRESV